MKFGLSEIQIGQICDVFKQYDQIQSAILYGSRAKGTFHKSSDIDLTLQGQNLSLDLLNKVSMALDDLLLPYEIDLSIYDHIDNPDLVDHIQRVGASFYSKHSDS